MERTEMLGTNEVAIDEEMMKKHLEKKSAVNKFQDGTVVIEAPMDEIEVGVVIEVVTGVMIILVAAMVVTVVVVGVIVVVVEVVVVGM